MRRKKLWQRRAERPLELVVCPECGAPAEVVERNCVASRAGVVETVRTLCLARHQQISSAGRLQPL